MIKPVTDSRQLTRLKLAGYKSIKSCDLEFGSLNVLIGANGAGKSNFIGFFRLIQQLIDENLQHHIGRQGGPDTLLHYGRKTTDQLHAELYFGNNGYWLTLEPTVDNRLMFADESFWWKITGPRSIGSGHFESTYQQGTGTGNAYLWPDARNLAAHLYLLQKKAGTHYRRIVQYGAFSCAVFWRF